MPGATVPPQNSMLPSQEVALFLTGRQQEVPDHWNLSLDVRDQPTQIFADGRVWRRTPLEVRARNAFEAHRDILTEGNYRISFSGDPSTIDILEIMRAKLLVSEGREPVEIVIAEEVEVIDAEPEPARVVDHRTRCRRLGHPDAELPEGMLVFDLSEEGGSDASGAQIPVAIPGARVIGWRGLRNGQQLLHEAYAMAAARSLVARAEHLGATRREQWGIYVGVEAQCAAAVLRGSRGFYGGRMLPILVREQWRNDVDGEAPRWRPLDLQLLESTWVA